MLLNLCSFLLTAFISVNGQLVEVPTDSVEYQNYINQTVTEIVTVSEMVEEPTSSPLPSEFPRSTDSPLPSESPAPTEIPSSVAAGDGGVAFVEVDSEEEIALLESIKLLQEENNVTLLELHEMLKGRIWLYILIGVVFVLILRRR